MVDVDMKEEKEGEVGEERRVRGRKEKEGKEGKTEAGICPWELRDLSLGLKMKTFQQKKKRSYWRKKRESYFDYLIFI